MFFKLPLLMLNRRCFSQLEDFCFPAGLLLRWSVCPETVAAAEAAVPSEASLRAPVDADKPRRRCLAACIWHWLQPVFCESFLFVKRFQDTLWVFGSLGPARC